MTIEQHIWHPYARARIEDNVLIDHGKGAYIYTTDGKQLMDCISSWWSVAYGHANPELVAALTTQAEKIPHVMFAGITHTPVQELTKKLQTLLHEDFDNFFYGDSGSIAVEVALKMALQYHKKDYHSSRNKFIALKNGYHGDTWNAMMVCDPVMNMHKLFTQHNDNIFLTPPPALNNDNFNADTCTFTDELTLEQIKTTQFIQELTHVLETQGNEIAAFILEPILQGAGGMLLYDIRYLDYAIALCQQYDVLVIFDEIATGFGRTGKDFAYQYLHHKPNILTLGKALTGGHITLGVTCADKQVTDQITNNYPHVFMHGPTFMGTPLATAVANKAVEIFTRDYSYQIANKPNKETLLFNKYFSNYRKQILSAQNPDIADVRHIGPIFVVEFTKQLDLVKIQQDFMAHGYWVRPVGNVLYLLLPNVVTENELIQLLDYLTYYVTKTNVVTDQELSFV